MKRLAMTVAAALFLVLAGTGTGHALWNSRSTASGAVSAGTIGISQAGFAALAVAYSPTLLADTAPVTLTNSGTVTAPYNLQLIAGSADNLARAITIATWPVGAAGDCTPSSIVPAGSTSNDFATGVTRTGSLAGGASTVVCVRTTISSADVTANSTASISGRLQLTSSLGSWVSSTSASVIQSVTDATAPSVPGTPTVSATTSTSATLNWAASSDNVGVTGYEIQRDGVAVATVTGTTYTSTGLVAGQTYSFRVRAKDAANNFSALSTATAVTAVALDRTAYYRVQHSSGLCLDANGNSGSGTALIGWICSGNFNQQWQFTPTTDGFHRVLARHQPTIGWDIPVTGTNPAGTTDGAPANVVTYAGAARQQWQVVQISAGVYHFVNRQSGYCLSLANGIAGTQSTQRVCSTSPTQNFSLTVSP